MERHVLVVLEPELAPGFKLAGVEVREVATPKDLEALLPELLESDRYGIIIVEESLLDQVDARLRNQALDNVVPVVLPVAMKDTERTSVEAYLEEMIRRSTGYQIKVRG